MTNNKVKELIVTVVSLTKKETGEKFNAYKVSTKKGGLYDLRFTKAVPEELRPTVSCRMYVNLDDVDFQEKNRTFPIVWVKGIIGFVAIETNKVKVDNMFNDVETDEEQEEQEDDVTEEQVDPNQEELPLEDK